MKSTAFNAVVVLLVAAIVLYWVSKTTVKTTTQVSVAPGTLEQQIKGILDALHPGPSVPKLPVGIYGPLYIGGGPGIGTV